MHSYSWVGTQHEPRDRCILGRHSNRQTLETTQAPASGRTDTHEGSDFFIAGSSSGLWGGRGVRIVTLTHTLKMAMS